MAEHIQPDIVDDALADGDHRFHAQMGEYGRKYDDRGESAGDQEQTGHVFVRNDPVHHEHQQNR